MLKILTKQELAEYLKCKETTIGHLVTSKQIPNFKVGKETRFVLEKIQEWIENRINEGNLGLC